MYVIHTLTMELFILLNLFIIPTVVSVSNEQVGELLELVLEELNDVKQSMTSLENEVEVLKKENAELKANERNGPHHVALSRGIQKRQSIEQVAFTVGVSASDVTHLGSHQPVPFDRAISNTGGAFHTHSSLFLSPIQGYYCFTLTVMVLPHKSSYLEIVIDGTPVNDILAASAGTYESTTKQWLLEVNKGSEVWVRSKTSSNPDIHGNMHTLLSGFLLFPTE